MIRDDKYIWALKKAGVPDDRIATKLGIPIEEIPKRLQLIKDTQEALDEVGIDHLINAFNATCFQYQLVGEGLKKLGANLCEPVTPQEVKDMLTDDPDQTVKNLMRSFIILRAWKSPEDELISGESEKIM